MQIKYKSIGKGTEDNPIRIDLPTYKMISQINADTFLIEVPDSFCSNGEIDNVKIQKLYDYSDKEITHLTEQEKAVAMSWKSKNYKKDEIK